MANSGESEPMQPDAKPFETGRLVLPERPMWAPAGENCRSHPIAPDVTHDLLNDHGNTTRIIRLYGQDLRYCHAMRKWLVWDGRRWALDETDRARKLAKQALLEALYQVVLKGCGKEAERFAQSSLDARRIASALSMAECELPVTPADLDRDPHLLNFRNGTLDLRSGLLVDHRREDLITRLVRYDYRPEAECPSFLRFLERIMGGGPEASESAQSRAARLIAYLQVAFGYSLTGLTSAKTVFLCHGFGNNGKTTLLSTFRHLLYEHAALLQIDTLMVRQESNNTQADLADLRGARFVMTSETEQGQRLAEGKLKRITQGMGRIKAVRKYENPIEFDETHKLWIDANHKPTIRGTDNAIWSRLHPIPFTVTIPDEEIDRDLPDKLLTEAEGILAWAVSGAQRWFREGLRKPGEVDDANRSWRCESDQIGRFVTDSCATYELAEVRARELYDAYKAWAGNWGEHVLRESDFAQGMAERGFSKRHTERATLYSGIGLKADG